MTVFVALLATLVVLWLAELFRLNVLRTKPGPLQWPLLYNLPQLVWFSRNGHHLQLLRDYHEHYRTSFVMRVPLVEFNFISLSPPDIEYVLTKGFKTFERSPLVGKLFAELLRDGIFAANGERWKQQRRFAVPIFSTAYLEQRMIPTFNTHVDDVVLRPLRDAARTRSPVDVYRLFMSYTMTTFVELGLGCGGVLNEDERALFARSFDYLSEACAARMRFSFGPLWSYLYGARFAESKRALDAIVAKCIEHRRRDSDDELRAKTDIFSTCLLHRDDDGRAMSDDELAKLFLNFLLAGRDTTAAAMTWLTYEVGRDEHRRVRDAIEAEVDAVVPGDAAEPITAAHLARLHYTRATMMETLRLHPSVPTDSRWCTEDTTLPSGYFVRRNSLVNIHNYAAGRMLFDDGDSFRPERFADDADARREYDKGFRYQPFWNGPQRCLGERMAYAEVLLVVASIVRARLRVRRDPAAPPFDGAVVPTIIKVPLAGMPCVVDSR